MGRRGGGDGVPGERCCGDLIAKLVPVDRADPGAVGSTSAGLLDFGHGEAPVRAVRAGACALLAGAPGEAAWRG